MKSQVRDTQSAEYAKLFEFPEGFSLKVGVLERNTTGGPNGSDVHDARSGLTIAELAEIHEFGLGHVPARPFVRPWFDANTDRIVAKLVEQFSLAVAGRITAEQAAERVALWAAADIQAFLIAGIPPPLSPSTIARKGSSTPLIDTGVLKSALSAYVELV